MSEVAVLIMPMGFELIGDVVNETATHITLENPVILTSKPGEKGELTYSFNVFSPLTEPVKEFNKSQTLCVTKTVDEIVNAYHTLTGKIVTPPSTLVLP